MFALSEKVKHRLLLALILLTTVPYIFIVNLPASWGVSELSRHDFAIYLASVFGYIGISLLIWNVLLGTRAISGLFFENLQSKIKLHRFIGTYGLFLIFLHPILIIYANSESLFYSVLPDFTSNYETYVTLGRFAVMALAIIWVTSAIARARITYRPWKYIHYLSYPILLLALLHVPPAGPSFSNQLIQVFWYSSVTVAIATVALRLRQLFGYGKVRYVVDSNEPLNTETNALVLHAVNKTLSIKDGQYIYLQLRLIGEEHPFTVLEYDNDTGKIMIAYKIVGSFTHKLETLKRGEVLYVDGPYGAFISHKDKPRVFIAGGIGITPFIKNSLHSSSPEDYLFYATRSSKTAIFPDVLKERLGDKFVQFYSSETLSDSAQNIESGRINQSAIEKYLSEPSRFDYFLCGPSEMNKSLRTTLLSMNVSPHQIHVEDFNL